MNKEYLSIAMESTLIVKKTYTFENSQKEVMYGTRSRCIN